MRILYLIFFHLNVIIGQFFYKIILVLKFKILGVSYVSFRTGGGLTKLYISRNGKLILGKM